MMTNETEDIEKRKPISLYERFLGRLPEAIIATLAALFMGCANLWITVRDHNGAIGELKSDVATLTSGLGAAARGDECAAVQRALVSLQIDLNRLEERVNERTKKGG